MKKQNFFQEKNEKTSNYMIENFNVLERAITEVINTSNSGFKVTGLCYDALDCSFRKIEAGAGIQGNLQTLDRNFNLFFPIKKMPNLDAFINHLNFTGVLVNAIIKFPDFNFTTTQYDLTKDTMEITYADKSTLEFALSKIYDRNTGTLNVDKFIQLQKDAGKIPIYRGNSDNFNALPPPFFMKKEQVEKLIEQSKQPIEDSTNLYKPQ